MPRRAPRLQVAVHQGRLSVNLWEADLGEVLAQIQQQAGISISVSPGPEHTVSVQFTDVALDQGLRRLLQLASQSYAMRYAPGPTGEVTLARSRSLQRPLPGTRAPPGRRKRGRSPGQRSASASSTPCCSAKPPPLPSHAKTRAMRRPVSERRWCARLRQPQGGQTHQQATRPVASETCWKTSRERHRAKSQRGERPRRVASRRSALKSSRRRRSSRHRRQGR